MSTIVHIPVKLPPVELGARQCKLPHVRVAASDKSINLLIILICPWHQPPKPPQREFWSSWQQNIQLGSFKATLWKGHREPKSLAPRKSVVGLFQTWGQPSRTLKPRDPFIKMVTSWIILTQIHLVILMVLETHIFVGPSNWVSAGSVAVQKPQALPLVRLPSGANWALKRMRFCCNCLLNFAGFGRWRGWSRPFFTKSWRRSTKIWRNGRASYKAWFQWVAISGELTFQKMMLHSQLKNGSPTQTRLEARSNSSGVMIILIKSTVATGPL